MFSCLLGPLRSCVLPQGATNSLPELQCCTTHMLQDEIPKNGNVFVDDVGLKGPTSTYNKAEIAPGIRRYVYEYASTFDRFLMRFIKSGITASGKKLVLATPHLHIVGTIISKDRWHLEHGLVTKILNWGPLTSITDVCLFLGTAGVEENGYVDSLLSQNHSRSSLKLQCNDSSSFQKKQKQLKMNSSVLFRQRPCS